MNLVLLFLYISVNITSTDTTQLVVYRHEIYKVDSTVKIPKIFVPEEFKSALGKDSILLTELISWPVIISIEMRINLEGDYIMSEHSETTAISLSDAKSKYFKNGKYFSGESDIPERALPITFEKRRESKKILGYECQRFIGTNSFTNDKYEIWATKQLPQTITGLYRLPQFGYGVLEISNLNGSWKRTAISVKLSKTN